MIKKVVRFLVAIGLIAVVMVGWFSKPSYAALDSNGYDASLDGFFQWPVGGSYTAQRTANASYDEWNNQGTYGIPSAYQYRINPVTGQYEFHDAIDIWAAEGTPVYAAADGKIRNVYYDGVSPGDIFGNSMYIDHGNGYATRYCHLSEISPGIYAGATVKKGQQIGKIGHTGYSEGPGANSQNPSGNHLDFAIAKSDPNAYIGSFYIGTATDNYVGQTNPLYYFGDDLKAFANKYYKDVSAEYGDPLGNGSEMPKNQVWSFPQVNIPDNTNNNGNGGGGSGGNNNQNSQTQNNTVPKREPVKPSFKGDCRDNFLGLTSWDCGVDIKDEESLKNGILTIAVNVLTDITVIAAYLVLGYVIYGGYLYVFSGGDPGKTATGKKTLSQAFIGLAIVMLASVIMSSIRIALLGANGVLGNCATEQCIDAGEMVTSIVNWVIGIAGIVSTVFVVEGGILYVTSSGEPEKLKKAKSTITYALIGLAIVGLSIAITAFVSNLIRTST